jgi:hypothetical protein
MVVVVPSLRESLCFVPTIALYKDKEESRKKAGRKIGKKGSRSGSRKE